MHEKQWRHLSCHLMRKTNQIHRQDKGQTLVTTGIRIQIYTKHFRTSEPGQTLTDEHTHILYVTSSCKHSWQDLCKRIRHLCAFMCCRDYWTHFLFISSRCWYHADHDGYHLGSGLTGLNYVNILMLTVQWRQLNAEKKTDHDNFNFSFLK